MSSTPSLDDDRWLYRPSGAGFSSGALTGGPWRSDAQHGGPPAALLAHVIESAIDDDERVARISVELVKPVPLVHLDVEVVRHRISRRVVHVDASLSADGTTVATARALVLATSDLVPPDWIPDETAELPDPEAARTAPSWRNDPEARAFHRDAVEYRFVSGGFLEPGPADAWLRLAVPVVDGSTPSPLQRVVAVADVGSGIGSVYGLASGIGLINADLTIAVHRDLEGEWVRLRPVTRAGTDGVGLCTTTLSDSAGVFGIATQSLVPLAI